MDNAHDAAPPDLGSELIRPAGDRAFLVTPGDHAAVTALVGALLNRPPDGVQDVLPAAETILVTLLSTAHAHQVRRSLDELVDRTVSARGQAVVSRGTLPDNGIAADTVEIPVHYNGADLADVARMLELSTTEVIAAHTGTIWRCAFVGFAPGFGYLESPDGRLSVPRRTQSRTTIPAGAVALAGGYTAVYPRSTPGGWQLIGTTELTMWDLDRDPPARIRAGATVRFVAMDRS